jgi:hypothetical protein
MLLPLKVLRSYVCLLDGQQVRFHHLVWRCVSTSFATTWGTAASLRKKLSMQVPLSYVLQAVGFHCCRLGICLDPQHVAGVRNQWADNLSRNCLEGFDPGRRVRLNVRKLMEEPWCGFS